MSAGGSQLIMDGTIEAAQSTADGDVFIVNGEEVPSFDNLVRQDYDHNRHVCRHDFMSDIVVVKTSELVENEILLDFSQ